MVFFLSLFVPEGPQWDVTACALLGSFLAVLPFGKVFLPGPPSAAGKKKDGASDQRTLGSPIVLANRVPMAHQLWRLSARSPTRRLWTRSGHGSCKAHVDVEDHDSDIAHTHTHPHTHPRGAASGVTLNEKSRSVRCTDRGHEQLRAERSSNTNA